MTTQLTQTYTDGSGAPNIIISDTNLQHKEIVSVTHAGIILPLSLLAFAMINVMRAQKSVDGSLAQHAAAFKSPQKRNFCNAWEGDAVVFALYRVYDNALRARRQTPRELPVQVTAVVAPNCRREARLLLSTRMQ